MATNRLLETRTTSFGELMGNGRRYKVPSFQRDYAWNVENWEDLWRDILSVHKTKESHFMGAIVTQSVTEIVTIGGEVLTVGGETISFGSQLFTVIDGQQRLATLSILVIAIIQQIQKLIDNGVDPDANRERQEILRRTYLGYRDAGSLRYASKLFLNENNDGFYQNNLINLRTPKNIYSLTKSERSLWLAFDYFSNQLAQSTEISKEGALLSDFLTSTVAQKLTFIQVGVENEANAYVLFETLNSRGVDLSATDLLKNYLFSLLKGPDDHRSANYEWQKIIGTVSLEAFPKFLRCFLSMTNRQVSPRRLFKTVRETVSSAEQSFGLLSQLSSYSDLYAALSHPADDFWRRYTNANNIRSHIREHQLLGAEQAYSALFAAYTAFDNQNFEKLLKLINVIFFRYWTVGGLNPNAMEKAFNELANDIAMGEVESSRAAFEKVSSLYVQDDKFRQDFAFLTLADKRDRSTTKYILKKLERDISGKEIEENSFSIEHILPQKPTDFWQQQFSQKMIDSLIYRLGNMTLLEPSLNRNIGAESYSIKKSAYSQSAYLLTQQIQADAWTADAIALRQEQMAKRAVHIWRIDY